MHVPVLLSEVMAALAPQSDGWYIDCTLGGGGHTEAILEASRPAGRVLALDRDAQAVALTRDRLKSYSARLLIVNRNFAEVGEVAQADNFTQVEGILLDLGLSSLQLSDESRGFSFQAEGTLDMRFDRTQALSAAEIVNQWPERELADLIYRYGEEPRSRAIARAIVRRRPLRTTTDLAEAVARAVRGRGRIHPATRTFQALRIVVNDELSALERALPQTVDLLRSGGRLAVISFHSLEDRIVKIFLREQQRAGLLSILTQKPIGASAAEIHMNPRSRSAKLRVAVRN